MNILLDRDGTIIEDRHYLHDPAQMVLLPSVPEALQQLASAGWKFFLVSNQSGVGRGYFSEKDVYACQRHLDAMLAEYGIMLQDSVWCPHAPEAKCHCRKPEIGLWQKLAIQHDLDPQQSIMIGDKIQDVRFAINANLAAGILALTGHGAEECRNAGWALPEHGKIRERKQEHKTRLFLAENLGCFADAIHNILRNTIY